jgi:hypothetical protein
MFPVRSRIIPGPRVVPVGMAGIALLGKRTDTAANDGLCKEANASGMNMGQDLCNTGRKGGLENFMWIITRYGKDGNPPIPEPWNTWLMTDASLKWEQSDEYKAAIAFADHVRQECRAFITQWNDFIRTVKGWRSSDAWKDVRAGNQTVIRKIYTTVAQAKPLLDRKAELDQVIAATTQKMFIPEIYKGYVITKSIKPTGSLDIRVLASDNATVLKTDLRKIDDAQAWVDEYIAKKAEEAAQQVAAQQQVNVQPGPADPGMRSAPGGTTTAPADDAAKKKKTALIVGGGAAAALLAMVAAR